MRISLKRRKSLKSYETKGIELSYIGWVPQEKTIKCFFDKKIRNNDQRRKLSWTESFTRNEEIKSVPPLSLFSQLILYISLAHWLDENINYDGEKMARKRWKRKYWTLFKGVLSEEESCLHGERNHGQLRWNLRLSRNKIILSASFPINPPLKHKKCSKGIRWSLLYAP